MAMWLSFLQHFRNQYRITLFDFPYQGKARVNKGSGDVTLDEQADILRAVIEGLGLERPTLCSSSWGGVIALLFATKYPLLTDKLVLGSVGLRPNRLMREVILKGIRMKHEDRQKLAYVIINNFGKDLPDEVKQQIVKQFQAMKEKQIQAFSQHGMSVILSESMDRVVPLGDIRAQTILLYGENDTIIDFKDVKALAALIPDCSIRIIPKTGHFMHMENEKVFDIYAQVLKNPSGTMAWHFKLRGHLRDQVSS